ncbi:MAG: hypothetical protein JNL58_06075 [Planctomyces sp.]|nr:hypothetical protein [Planctomyces sp.]
MNAPVQTPFRSMLLIMFAVSGLLFCGCTEAPRELPLRPQDDKVAADAVAILRTTIENLPESDPLIQRYGKLKTIEIKEVVQHRNVNSSQPGRASPPMLRIKCRSQFEKYPTLIEVTVIEFPDGTTPAFETPEVPITIEPSLEKTTELEASGYKPIVLADELWFGQNIGDSIHVHCSVGTIIRHPDFKP